MTSSQHNTFADTERDRWFAPNNSQLEEFDPRVDPVCKLFELYSLKPQKAIVIGAANRGRLEAIPERYPSNVIAVHVSNKALADGRSKLAHIRFIQEVAHAITTKVLFDLVIINFVFNWIERSNLLRSVGEIDRVVMDGGSLVIGDFYPSNLSKVRYNHTPDDELYTYKQDYAGISTASGLYPQVCVLTGDHSSAGFEGEVSGDRRTAAWLLHKTLGEQYIERTLRR
jgi:trans-aconitate methyltransferase